MEVKEKELNIKKEPEVKAEPEKTEAEINLELKKLELEIKQLEAKEKKANLQDLQERLDERELRRETKRQRSKTNGVTISNIARDNKRKWSSCNHRKGGNGQQGFVGGQGDDSQFAVLKHTFCNGDMWVRCLRCGKTWKPPAKSEFTLNGKFDELEFKVAEFEYKTALLFQTRNTASGSVTFRFSDNGEDFRERAMKDVNLQ